MLEAVETSVLRVPVVDHPPPGARIGDVVYREDREEYAVSTVLGWIPCRPSGCTALADR